jgi:hypothetical protein
MGKSCSQSYEDGSSNSTAFINNVNVSTGEISEITRVVEYLDGEPRLSPSGNKVAIGYGTVPMAGVVDVVMVNLSTKSQTLLTDSLQNARAVNGNIIRFRWVNDDAVLVDAQSGSTFSSFLIKS